MLQAFKKRQSYLNALPFVIGFALGLYFITLNITGRSFTNFPGDLGDARFNNYILEHDHKFFTGQEHSLWNAPFMFPVVNVVTYSDNLVGAAPFYSLFRLLNFDRETSFQCWFVLLVFLNYACCYWFLNICFRNRYAAALGAMVFAFSMALQSQVTHVQTFPRFPIPLTFLAGIFFIKDFKPRYFLLMLLMVVYQLYCGLYLGFMLLIPFALFILFGVGYKWELAFSKFKNLKWMLLMLLSIIINVLLVLPLMIPYWQRSRNLGLNEYVVIFHSIPSVKSFFYSQPGSLFWKCFQRTCETYPCAWDHQLFAGGMATLSIFIFGIIILFTLRSKKAWVNTVSEVPLWIYLFTAVFTFVLFTRFGNFSLYQYVFHIPGFASMRALQRIINIYMLFFAIAVAFVVTLLLKNAKRLTFPLFFAAVGLFIADNYFREGTVYSTPKEVSQKRVNALIEKMRSIPKGSVVSCETDKKYDRMLDYQIDVMLATQTLNLKCFNGYTGYPPPGYGSYWNDMNENARKDWIKYNNLDPSNIYIVTY